MPTPAGKPRPGDTVTNGVTTGRVLKRYPGQIAYAVDVQWIEHPVAHMVGCKATITEFDWCLQHGWTFV